jgi:TonB family protein
MNSFKHKLFFNLILTSLVLMLSAFEAAAQSLSFDYYYKVVMTGADEYPKIGGLPSFDYPEEARKNGVTGTVKAELTLGEDGKTREIVIVQGLPQGVTEMFTKALQNLYFQPAKRKGKPVAVKMTMDFIVTAEYDEDDKNVTKAKIVEKPAPVYPPNQLADKVKGKVSVKVRLFADGTLKLLGVNSTMPKEFDKAALAAAAKIKFSPAVHKKSKQLVSQEMTVVYDFKP